MFDYGTIINQIIFCAFCILFFIMGAILGYALVINRLQRVITAKPCNKREGRTNGNECE